MAIFTFSTKEKKPQDEELVKEIKEYCDKHCIVFSSVILSLLRSYKEENLDGRQD